MKTLLLTLFLSAAAGLFPARAQVGVVWDFPTWEALITEHKTVKGPMQRRTIAETTNNLEHEISETSNKAYKEANDVLDKYQKITDIFNLVCDGSRVAFLMFREVPKTVKDIKGSIGMVNGFLKKYASRLGPSDVELLNICIESFNDFSKDAEGVYKLAVHLAYFCTGKVRCSAADLTHVVDEFEYNIKSISAHASKMYISIYNYIFMRTHFFRPETHARRLKTEIIKEVWDGWSGRRKKQAGEINATGPK